MPTYYRCSHCRGFYETSLAACKFCNYKTVLTNPDQSPKIFPDRETCRAIQIAEHEQLPPDAINDPMRPDKDDLAEICNCLHCGPGEPPFEAVEMRWIPNERMWACPCTTCGGRGFHIDIHPVAPRWECANCRHKWAPPGGNAKPSNCKCPKCGCTQANGFFDDEYSEEEIAAMTEDQYKQVFGKTRAEEEAEWRVFNERFKQEEERKRLAGEPPFDAQSWRDYAPDVFNPANNAPAENPTPCDPEAHSAENSTHECPRIPDDIDHPRHGRPTPNQSEPPA